MVDFRKSDEMIKISGKVDKPTLITDSIIFRSLLETGADEVLSVIKNKILLLSVLVYPFFHLLNMYKN